MAAAIAAVLDAGLLWGQGLRPLAVLAPVPIEPVAVTQPHDRGRMPRRIHVAYIGPELSVCKIEFRIVAGGAGDRAVRAEARIEKEGMTQRDRLRVVANRIGGIGRQRRQPVDAEGGDQPALGLRPPVGRGVAEMKPPTVPACQDSQRVHVGVAEEPRAGPIR